MVWCRPSWDNGYQCLSTFTVWLISSSLPESITTLNKVWVQICLLCLYLIKDTTSFSELVLLAYSLSVFLTFGFHQQCCLRRTFCLLFHYSSTCWNQHSPSFNSPLLSLSDASGTLQPSDGFIRDEVKKEKSWKASTRGRWNTAAEEGTAEEGKKESHHFISPGPWSQKSRGYHVCQALQPLITEETLLHFSLCYLIS